MTQDIIFRKVRGILNKITPETFDKLSKDLINVGLDSPVTLRGVIYLIFDKALKDLKYSSLYAKLCQELSEKVPNFEQNKNGPNTFCRFLISKCEDEFERRRRATEDFDNKLGELTDEEYELRAIAKQKMLGNIKFICELGKKRLLQEEILHECIRGLLSKKKERPIQDQAQDLECLCQIMRTIGSLLDIQASKNLMNQYFERIDLYSKKPELPSRIRFMLKDVIDLRKNNWKLRPFQREDNAPQTLSKLREDVGYETGLANNLGSSLDKFGNNKNLMGDLSKLTKGKLSMLIDDGPSFTTSADFHYGPISFLPFDDPFNDFSQPKTVKPTPKPTPIVSQPPTADNFDSNKKINFLPQRTSFKSSDPSLQEPMKNAIDRSASSYPRNSSTNPNTYRAPQQNTNTAPFRSREPEVDPFSPRNRIRPPISYNNQSNPSNFNRDLTPHNHTHPHGGVMIRGPRPPQAFPYRFNNNINMNNINTNINNNNNNNNVINDNNNINNNSKLKHPLDQHKSDPRSRDIVVPKYYDGPYQGSNGPLQRPFHHSPPRNRPETRRTPINESRNNFALTKEPIIEPKPTFMANPAPQEPMKNAIDRSASSYPRNSSTNPNTYRAPQLNTNTAPFRSREPEVDPFSPRNRIRPPISYNNQSNPSNFNRDLTPHNHTHPHGGVMIRGPRPPQAFPYRFNNNINMNNINTNINNNNNNNIINNNNNINNNSKLKHPLDQHKSDPRSRDIVVPKYYDGPYQGSNGPLQRPFHHSPPRNRPETRRTPINESRNNFALTKEPIIEPKPTFLAKPTGRVNNENFSLRPSYILSGRQTSNVNSPVRNATTTNTVTSNKEAVSQSIDDCNSKDVQSLADQRSTNSRSKQFFNNNDASSIKESNSNTDNSDQSAGNKQNIYLDKFKSILAQSWKTPSWNFGNITAKIKDLKIPKTNQHECLVLAMKSSISSTDSDRDNVGKLISHLVPSTFDVSCVTESFKMIFEELNTLEVETPRVKSLLAGILTQTVLDNLISFEDVAEMLRGGKHHPLFLLFLQRLHQRAGQGWLNEKYIASKINLMEMLPEVDQTRDRLASVLKDRSLGFLDPMLTIEPDLWQQMKTKDASPAAVYRWVKDNVHPNIQTTPAFAHVLITCLLRYIDESSSNTEIKSVAVPDPTKESESESIKSTPTSSSSQNFEAEKELLTKYQQILQALIKDKQMQLATLYSLQSFYCKLDFPKGALLRWFDMLYDLNVIDEDVYFIWKEEINDHFPGKGQALFQVNTWLNWLAEAESEDEEEDG